MRKIYLVPLVVLLATISMVFDSSFKEKSEARVVFDAVTVSAEVSDAPDERMRGLSGRERMGAKEGMLFVFPEAEILQFWMKNMRFPLDVIWIDGGKVQTVSERVLVPNSRVIPQMDSGVPVRYALEVHAGFAEQWGIQAGDAVTIEP